MVEALIVIALLLLGVQCTWGMYQLSLHQHRAQLQARSDAWASALEGCDTLSISGVVSALTKSGSQTEVDDVGGLARESEQAPGWLAFGTATPGSAQLDLPPTILDTTEVRSTQKFACNERGGQGPLSLVGGFDGVISNVMDVMGSTQPDDGTSSDP